MKHHILVAVLWGICSLAWEPLFSMEEKKRKREEEPELIEAQPELKKEKLEENEEKTQETKKSNVPSLFQLTLPYLRQYTQQLLNEKKSIQQLEKKIPIEVFAAIFNDPLFFGNTILHQVADNNDIPFLLTYGADPNIVNYDNQTVLNYYLALRNTAAAKKLLEFGNNSLDIDSPDIFGSTPLLNAIKTGDSAIVESILNRADGNPEIDMHDFIVQSDLLGQTPCLLASHVAPELLPLLMPYSDFEYGDLLIDAVKNNNLKSIKILLEHGYPIDLVDKKYRRNALMYALELGLEAEVIELLKYKPNLKQLFFEPHHPQGYTTLARAAVNSENPALIEHLLQAGFPIDFGSDQDGTMLYHAIEKNNLELVRFLLSHGADPNKGDSEEHPLELIWSNESDSPEQNNIHYDILIELLKDPRIHFDHPHLFNQGTTLLTAFLEKILPDEHLSPEKKIQIIQLLIERGSLITKEDLEIAKDYPEIYQILEEH